MSKIYNEIVIDMNPESPTFEETLYEDSFEYSGDMILFDENQYSGEIADGTQMAVSEPIGEGGRSRDNDTILYTIYEWKNGKWESTGAWTKNLDNVSVPIYDSLNLATSEEVKKASPVSERSDVGLPDMTEERWFGMTLEQQAQYILDVKYAGDTRGIDGIADTEDDVDLKFLMEKLENQPLLGEVDPTERGFLSEEYGGAGVDGIEGTEDDISFADSLAGRKADIDYKTAGITYDEAGLTYGAAGRSYETAGLAYEGAGIQKETMLSGLQSQMETFAPAVSTGVDTRTKIRGMEKIKKGFETGMDVYGIAGEQYDIAGDAYSAAGQAYGLAGETYDIAGDKYDLAESGAEKDYREQIYTLQTGVGDKWAGNWSSFLNTLPSATGNN